MKDQFFILLGKLTVALVAILVFLAVGVGVSHQVIKSAARYENGQAQIIAEHKAWVAAKDKGE